MSVYAAFPAERTRTSFENFGRDPRYPIVNRFRDPGLRAQAIDRAAEIGGA